MKFKVQHDGTDPAKWETVDASSRRVAGAMVAARHGPGFVTVYVAHGPTHPNGAPINVDKIIFEVTKRPQESEAIAEGGAK